MLHFVESIICTIICAIMVIDVVSIFVPLKFWDRKMFSRENQFKMHIVFAAVTLFCGYYIIALIWAGYCYREYNELKASGIDVWGKK